MEVQRGDGGVGKHPLKGTRGSWGGVTQTVQWVRGVRCVVRSGGARVEAPVNSCWWWRLIGGVAHGEWTGRLGLFTQDDCLWAWGGLKVVVERHATHALLEGSAPVQSA